MNQENLRYLKDTLKYLGFGDELLFGDQLESAISQEPLEFNLYDMVKYDEHSVYETKLYFRRHNNDDRYYFSKYDALLRYDESPEKNRAQTFYIFKGMGVTCKEGYNLLQGRSVFKKLTNRDGDKYEAWIKLNFDEKDDYDNYKTWQFGSRHGFDLITTLKPYQIREMDVPELRDTLLRSLQRGNLQSVTIEKSPKAEKLFIEACPQFKTINIYRSSSRGNQKKPVPGDMPVNMAFAPVQPENDSPQTSGDNVDIVDVEIEDVSAVPSEVSEQKEIEFEEDQVSISSKQAPVRNKPAKKSNARLS